LDRVISMLRARLPASWTADVETEQSNDSGIRVDAQLRLRAPDGASAVVLIEAKRLLNTRDVPIAIDALRRAAARWGTDEVVMPLLAARYLAPGTRERIVDAGAGYADATGNLRLELAKPALFVSDRGFDKDPWRGPGRPRGTLNGHPAARVVRALADFASPMTVPELAERAGASTGATYRVVKFADEEGLIEQSRRGPIVNVRWRALLERWSEDYGFARSNTVVTFLEPRGLRALVDRLREAEDLAYVVTGWLASEQLAPYAPPRLGTIYVRNIMEAARQLGLREVDAGANVALAAGEYDVVFDRPRIIDGVRFAAPSQVAVDLMTGPGRNPSEGLALLDWMEANERQWRQ